VIELAPGETSLSFLQKVYRGVKQPMLRRLRAAMEALPHEHPRLGVSHMNGQDFAAMLEKQSSAAAKGVRLSRSKAVRVRRASLSVHLNRDSPTLGGRGTRVTEVPMRTPLLIIVAAVAVLTISTLAVMNDACKSSYDE
jgi:hypothetical protein